MGRHAPACSSGSRAGLDRRAALFGAMLLAFSGFYLWHYQHVNVVSGLAHVPWLLLATDVLFETLLVVLVTTLVVLASRRFRGAMLALVVITAADIGWWGYQEVFRRPPRSIHALLDGIDAPGAQSPAESIFVRNAESEGNLLTLAGYRLASG